MNDYRTIIETRKRVQLYKRLDISRYRSKKLRLWLTDRHSISYHPYQVNFFGVVFA